MYRMKNLLITIWLMGLTCPATAQKEDNLPDGQTARDTLIDYLSFTHYQAGEVNQVFRISLTTDIRKLKKTKAAEKYQKAILAYTGTNGQPVEREVRIRTRGNFRKDYCNFPPIRISFSPEKDTTPPVIPALKLVTHCRDSDPFEKYVLKEYLAYRFYNLITDWSLRARLLEVSYIDSRGKTEPVTRYAFVIESEKQIEHRLDGRFLEDREVSIIRTDYETCNRLALFEYMIGNTDWQVLKQHNIEVFQFKDSTSYRPVPIPYDFDYSGLVNAYYAVPHDDLPIETVTERLYLGSCIHETEFQRFFSWYIEMKPQFMGLVNDFHLLGEREQREVRDYLEGFYEIISDERLAKTHIMSECLGR